MNKPYPLDTTSALPDQMIGSSSPAPCSVELTSRQVIEKKLLTALEDGNTVAILASEEDLKLLIFALAHCSSPKAMPMARDLGQLLSEAFPPNAAMSDCAGGKLNS